MDELKVGIKKCYFEYGLRLNTIIKIVKNIYFEIKDKENNCHCD